MNIEYIRYLVSDPSRRDALVAAYTEAAKSLDQAPECLGYDLAVCDEDPSAAILRIDWTSREAHLNGFLKGPHFAPFFAAIQPFLAEIAEMRHYTPTSVIGRKTPEPNIA